MRRHPLISMAVGWVVVVVAVAAVTFVVVDRAGRGVGQASAARTLAAVPTSEVTATPTESRSPTRPVTPAPTSSGGSDPTTGPSQPPLLDEPRTAAFTTRGGTVVVTCEGLDIGLDSITPRDGWRFTHEVEHGGIEVKLTAAEDKVELVLGCVRGAPTRLEG